MGSYLLAAPRAAAAPSFRPLQDIELVGISQGTSEPFHNPQPTEQRRQSPLWGGDLNRSTQHLLILLDKEVADGDVTDIVHGEAEG